MINNTGKKYHSKQTDGVGRFYIQSGYKNQCFHICIQVSYSGWRIHTTINRQIKSRDNWDMKSQRCKENNKEMKQMNRKLNQLIKEINDLIDKNEKILNRSTKREEVLQIIDNFKSDKPQLSNGQKSFIEYFEQFIDDTKSGKRKIDDKIIERGTWKTYQTTMNHLKSYAAKRKTKLTFSGMDKAFYEDFIQYLTSEKLSDNYQASLVKVLKVFLSWCIQNEYSQDARFIRLFKKNKKRIRKIALTTADIQKIINYKPETAKLQHIKDLFLIGYYSCFRYSDLQTLKPEHINLKELIIIKNQVKTNNTVTVPIRPELAEIFLKYPDLLFGYISAQKFNEYLKDLCQRAGILDKVETIKFIGGKPFTEVKPKYELVSSHIMRRSGLTHLKQLGAANRDLMTISGHETEASLESYLNIEKTESLNQLRQLWDKKPDKPD